MPSRAPVSPRAPAPRPQHSLAAKAAPFPTSRSGKTPDEAMEAVKDVRAQLKEEKRELARIEAAEMRRQREELEREERARAGEAKLKELEERLR